eukprot:scaffold33581_cov64-Isochrysis_galbana.AAC.1
MSPRLCARFRRGLWPSRCTKQRGRPENKTTAGHVVLFWGAAHGGVRHARGYGGPHGGRRLNIDGRL